MVDKLADSIRSEDGKVDLAKLIAVAFRDVRQEGIEDPFQKRDMYPALAKLSCEYCAACHCAGY